MIQPIDPALAPPIETEDELREIVDRLLRRDMIVENESGIEDESPIRLTILGLVMYRLCIGKEREVQVAEDVVLDVVHVRFLRCR